MNYGIIILAGGTSSRMGTNKALLAVRGKPMIERIRDELKQAVSAGQPEAGSGREAESDRKSPFVIVANDPALYCFLGEKTVPDRYPGRGPLAGIEAGLRASPYDWNLVAACDMPFVTAQAGRFLLEQAAAEEQLAGMGDAVSKPGANGSQVSGSCTGADAWFAVDEDRGIGRKRPSQVDAVVPVIDGRLQPLFAVYHKRCADRIERLLQAEQLKMTDLLEQLRVKRVTEADFPAAIDTSRVFVNMNRPEEYEQVQRMLDAWSTKINRK